MNLLRGLLDVAFPPGDRARHTILVFHRVLAEPDYFQPNEWCRDAFERVLRILKKYFNVITVSEYCFLMNSGRPLPARSISITFDDGYADNYTEAFPLLMKFGLRATFFVTSGVLDGGRMWNDTIVESVRRIDLPSSVFLREFIPDGSLENENIDRRELAKRIIDKCKYLDGGRRGEVVERLEEEAGGLPVNMMMTSEQVAELARDGMEIGGHTDTHPILVKLPDTEAEREIIEGKKSLEAVIGKELVSFAYPNGRIGADYDRRHTEMVRRLGFRAAVTTNWGVASRETSPWELPRFTPWSSRKHGFLAGIVRNRYGLI